MSNDNKQRVTLFLDQTIVKHAKAQAVIDGLSLTNLVEKALVDHLPHKTIIKKIKIVKNKEGEKI